MKPTKTFTQAFYHLSAHASILCSSERSFSAMHRIKNYLRTIIEDERLSNCPTSHVYWHWGSNWLNSLHWKKEKLILSEANQKKIVFSCRILQISIIWSTVLHITYHFGDILQVKLRSTIQTRHMLCSVENTQR